MWPASDDQQTRYGEDNRNVPTPDSSSRSERKVDPGARIRHEEERRVKIFARQMLSQRQFVGTYQERRWTDPVGEYRDLIVLNHGSNGNLIEDLEVVRKRLNEHYQGSKWIGVSAPKFVGAPAAGYCVWLELNNVPLGKHNFLIKKVKFTEKEVSLEVKCTSYLNETSEDCVEPATTVAGDDDPAPVEKRGETAHFNIDLEEMRRTLNEACASAYSLMTIENTKQVLSFIAVALMFVLTALCKLVYHSGDFTLKLVDRLTNLLQVLMPLLLSLLDLVKKTVGGFYILLAMMWRSFMERNNPPFRPLPQQMWRVGGGEGNMRYGRATPPRYFKAG